jgi:hypothetical protein
MSSTTIKVPTGLRDRLADRARELHTTLAGAIERALDESDERLFWAAVRREHDALAPVERAEYLPAIGTETLADDADDQLSAAGAW